MPFPPQACHPEETYHDFRVFICSCDQFVCQCDQEEQTLKIRAKTRREAAWSFAFVQPRWPRCVIVEDDQQSRTEFAFDGERQPYAT